MTRYRVTVAANPIGPWRAHREVALIDALDAQEASIDPDNGRIFSGALTRIKTDPQDEPATAEEDMLAEAVSTLHTHGNGTPVYAKEQAAGFDHRPELAERWQRIGRLAEDLLRRAKRRRGPELQQD